MSPSPASLRTPLGRVRFLGAAQSGVTDAWLMRLTSLALVPLTIGFVWIILDVVNRDYNGVRAGLSHPLPAIVLLAFIVAGVVHMEIGMRSIIVDYLGGRARGWALLANACFSAVLALACVYATLRLAFT